MKLEKAWDFKALQAELKPIGLEIGEEAAKVIFVKALEFIEASVIASETKYDDLVVALIPPVKSFVLAEIEKLNPAD